MAHPKASLTILVILAALQAAASEPVRPSILVLPPAAGPGLDKSEQFLGFTLQNLFENALVEDPGVEETWFQEAAVGHFHDLDRWHNFQALRTPGDEFTGFACVAGGELRHSQDRYVLRLAIRHGPKIRTASLPVDFPGLREVRRRFLAELHMAGCGASSDAPPQALWPEQLPPAAAAVLGRGLEHYLAILLFGGGSRTGDIPESVRLAPASYLAHIALGWVYCGRGDVHERDEFESAVAIHRGIRALDGLAHSREIPGLTALVHERAQRRVEPQQFAVGRALAGRALWLAWQNQYEAALPIAGQALAAATEAKDRAREAAVLMVRGYTYCSLKQLDPCVADVEQALKISSALKDARGQATALGNLGYDYSASQQFDKGIVWYTQAVALRRQVKDPPGEAAALMDLALGYVNLTEYDKAIDYYLQALGIERELKNRSGEAATLASLAWVHGELKQYAKALEDNSQALAIQRELKDRPGERTSLTSLAWIDGELQQYDKAVEHNSQALAIQRELKDLSGQGASLSNLAWDYGKLQDHDKEVSFYEQALAVEKEANDRAGQAATLASLALIESNAGEQEQAAGYLEALLALRRELQDRRGEIEVLLALGDTDYKRERSEESIRRSEQALAMARESKDRPNEAKALNNLVVAYERLRRHDVALYFGEQALAAARAIESDPHTRDWLVAISLANLGSAYTALNQIEKSIDYTQQALTLSRTIQDRTGEIRAISNLGNNYSTLGQPQVAVSFYEQAARLMMEAKEWSLAGGELDLWANAAIQLAQYDKAVQASELALEVERSRHDRFGEGRSLALLGLAAGMQGDYEKGIGYVEQSLVIMREVKDPLGVAIALRMLAELHQQLKHYPLAIIYGKLAVNQLQGIRNANGTLGDESRKSLEEAFRPNYDSLAQRLIDQGRLSEALLVLDMLKEKEAQQYVRGGTPQAGPAGQIPLGQEELRAASLINSSSEFSALVAKPEKTPGDFERLRVLNGELAAGNRSFHDQLASLFAADPKLAIDQTAVKEHIGALQSMLQQLGMPAVAVYTLLGEKQISLIVVTPQSASYVSSTADRQQVLNQIAAFQQKLRDPSSDPLPESQALYKLLFEPIRPLLEASHAKVVYWHLHSQLRYVPVGALFDGKHYVAELYQDVLLNIQNQTSLLDPGNPQWSAYGFGVSQSHPGFAALPFVDDELHRIIADPQTPEARPGALPGKILLDGKFTKAAFEEQMFSRRPVVHIASHFHFDPTDGSRSFLLMGDGSSLSVNELADMTNLFQNVDLVTFSACETALGQRGADGQEVDALADVAMRKGAKAVMATLWPVNDRATGLFMAEFYRIRQRDKLTKSEALQRAQLEMIRGEIKPASEMSPDRGVQVAGRASPQKQDFSHPYYWAPFILIGNLK